jgi:hypothetical protein
MKKLFVLFLVFVFAAGIFAPKAQAQFHWELITDFNTGLLTHGIPLGERAEKFLTIDDIPQANNIINNPVTDRGNYTYTTGYLDLLSYGSGKWLRGNELRLTIGYTGENIAFHTMTLLDALVRPDISSGAGLPNEFGPGHSFVQTPNNARTVNWGDFLMYSFEEYFFRGTAGIFTGYVGNTPDRGKVDGFITSFSDDLLRTIRVENYGVITPDANADFLDGGQDTNNFMRPPRIRSNLIASMNTDDFYGWVDVPYFMVAARFENLFPFPLTVQLAADPGNNNGINPGGGKDTRDDFDYISMNGAIRISGENIADWVTFDAIYRFRGGDPNTLDSFDPDHNASGIIQPDGLGIYAHTFGVYANILGVPDIGIGLGYSGYVKIFEEDRETGTEIINVYGPMFHGIDLRLQYTGINNLTVTLANNFSIATIRRSIDDPIIAMGVLGRKLPTGTSQRWTAIYNALGLDYQLNDQLMASLQLGSRYGVIETVYTPLAGGSHTTTRSRHQLGGGAFIAYQANRNFHLQGGIILRYLNDSYTNTAPGAQDAAETRNASGGMFDFAFPIRMRMVFGNK